MVPQALELRLTVLAVAVFALIVWYGWAKRQNHVSYVMPIFLWLINLSAYQVSRIVDPGIAFETMSYWGVALNLHAALTLAGIGFILWREKA